MSAASNYLEDKLLDHALGVATYTAPATLYIGLFTGTAGANLEAGVLSNEVSGGSYARKTITFTTAASGVSSNNGNVTFDTATASWGTVTHVAILDAATSGNVLFWGAVTTPKTIDIGDTFQVNSGNLTISLA